MTAMSPSPAAPILGTSCGLPAVLADISETGCRILVLATPGREHERLRPFSRISLGLGNQELSAEVRWRQDGAVAFEFGCAFIGRRLTGEAIHDIMERAQAGRLPIQLQQQ